VQNSTLSHFQLVCTGGSALHADLFVGRTSGVMSPSRLAQDARYAAAVSDEHVGCHARFSPPIKSGPLDRRANYLDVVLVLYFLQPLLQFPSSSFAVAPGSTMPSRSSPLRFRYSPLIPTVRGM